MNEYTPLYGIGQVMLSLRGLYDGNGEKVLHFLFTPHPMLYMKTPHKCCETEWGFEDVMNLLKNIIAGNCV